MTRIRRTTTAVLAVTTLGLAGAAPAALARHGADDPAGHDAAETHHVRHHGHAARHHHQRHQDDGAGHVRGGADDGPNHS